MAARKRIRSLTARSSPALEIPKIAVGVIRRTSVLGDNAETARFAELEEDPSEQVADSEEDEDHGGHDQGHQADHHQEARAAIVHGSEARGARLPALPHEVGDQ